MPKNKPGLHLKKGAGYTWYWNLVSSNGRIICRSSEVYTRKANAIKSIKAAANHFDQNQHYWDDADTKHGSSLVVYNIKS